MALVAGKKRVPSPATGNTALRIRFWGAGMGNSERVGLQLVRILNGMKRRKQNGGRRLTIDSMHS